MALVCYQFVLLSAPLTAKSREWFKRKKTLDVHQLAAGQPNYPSRELAASQHELARCLVGLNRRAEAPPFFYSAVKTYEKLAADQPDYPSHELAVTQRELTRCLEDLNLGTQTPRSSDGETTGGELVNAVDSDGSYTPTCSLLPSATSRITVVVTIKNTGRDIIKVEYYNDGRLLDTLHVHGGHSYERRLSIEHRYNFVLCCRGEEKRLK